MKTIKRITSIILTIILSFNGAIAISADNFVIKAAELWIDSEVIDENDSDEEFLPLAAARCETFDWSNSHHTEHQSLTGYESKPNHGVFSASGYASLGGLAPSGASSVNISGLLGTYIFRFPNAGIHYSYGQQVGECNNITVKVNLGVGKVITAYPSM